MVANGSPPGGKRLRNFLSDISTFIERQFCCFKLDIHSKYTQLASSIERVCVCVSDLIGNSQVFRFHFSFLFDCVGVVFHLTQIMSGHYPGYSSPNHQGNYPNQMVNQQMRNMPGVMGPMMNMQQMPPNQMVNPMMGQQQMNYNPQPMQNPGNSALPWSSWTQFDCSHT